MGCIIVDIDGDAGQDGDDDGTGGMCWDGTAATRGRRVDDWAAAGTVPPAAEPALCSAPAAVPALRSVGTGGGSMVAAAVR